jgi:hypothetical protein
MPVLLPCLPLGGDLQYTPWPFFDGIPQMSFLEQRTNWIVL